MTNDDILKAVARDYQTIEADSDLHNCIRSLVIKAYEEAARMVCNGCLNDRKLISTGTDGQLRHVAYEMLFPCRAEGIHALKDSLAAENKLHTEANCAV